LMNPGRFLKQKTHETIALVTILLPAFFPLLIDATQKRYERNA
jgi:hypothetical protein